MGLTDKSSCQTNDSGQSDSETSNEEQKLKVMAARNNEINSLLAQAISLYKHKQFEQAIDLFNQVIRLDPQNASAHFSLGITLEANHDLTGAADHYAIAHEIDPGNNEYQRAVLGMKSKEEKEKETNLDQQKQKALAAQASDAFKRRQYEQALSLYQTLEKENPHLAFAKYNIGTIYLILKKPDDALNYYKEAHKLDPENKQYAESLEKLKQNIKQIEDEKKAEKLSPEKTSTNNNNGSKNKNERLTNESALKNILSYCGLRVKSGKDGVLIEATLSGSRAAQVGLQPGDIIKVIDGQPIKKANQLEKTLRSKPLGQRFQLLVLRRGQTGVILF
jgi:tetratricopeptide (TPR) repeat protein